MDVGESLEDAFMRWAVEGGDTFAAADIAGQRICLYKGIVAMNWTRNKVEELPLSVYCYLFISKILFNLVIQCYYYNNNNYYYLIIVIVDKILIIIMFIIIFLLELILLLILN